MGQRQAVVRAKASRDEAIEMTATLFAHGIFSSVVPSDYRARLTVSASLLHWLASMANLSDGLCRLVCEQVSEWVADVAAECSLVSLNTHACAAVYPA